MESHQDFVSSTAAAAGNDGGVVDSVNFSGHNFAEIAVVAADDDSKWGFDSEN